MRRFLIVGTGRSGTGWCAEQLNLRGIKCGHQDVIRHEHVLGRPWKWRHWEGESSFEAVPLLSKLDGSMPIILVVRKKEDVVASWLRLGAFQGSMREDFLLWSIVLDKKFPDVLAQPTPEARAGTYWEQWNAHARRFVDDEYRLEDIDPNDLPAMVGR